MTFWNNLLKKYILPQENNESTNEPKTQFDTAKSEQASNVKRETGYPNTYKTHSYNDQEIRSPKVFDPALKQFLYAFRHGEPAFQNSEASRRWHDARMQVIDHLLRIINNSKWKEHLVLRGSLLLKAWLGNAAREPGDIDWIFRPINVGINDSLAVALFDDLTQMVTENYALGNTVIKVDGIAVDDIWTYERADGRRIVFPWKSEGLPSGVVQMDVVFSEKLWTEPILTSIPITEDSTLVWAASKEVSLAWKLLWLQTDMYPQGKDLYDAALLAEQTQLPLTLLKLILQEGGWYSKNELTPEFPLQWEVDWENFKLEYPWVHGEAKDWQVRLSSALRQSFADNG